MSNTYVKGSFSVELSELYLRQKAAPEPPLHCFFCGKMNKWLFAPEERFHPNPAWGISEFVELTYWSMDGSKPPAPYKSPSQNMWDENH